MDALVSGSDKFSKGKMDLTARLARAKEVQEKKMIDKNKQVSQIEVQLEEKSRRLEASNKERDILEKELITTRSELAGVRRTLGKLVSY